MNFLKISVLLIGTGSVVGGTGAGIYYVVNKNNKSDTTVEVSKKVLVSESEIAKTQFDGKLAFFKKSGNDTNVLYEVKLLTNSEYTVEVQKFNQDTTAGSQHNDLNKFIDISHLLNVENTKSELTNIFTTEITLENAKTKITSEETKLKGLFGEAIYANLKTLIP